MSISKVLCPFFKHFFFNVEFRILDINSLWTYCLQISSPSRRLFSPFVDSFLQRANVYCHFPTLASLHFLLILWVLYIGLAKKFVRVLL